MVYFQKPMNKLGLFFCSAFFLFFQLSAAGAEIVLFQDTGTPVENYEQLAQSLQPGDRIKFSNGKIFTLQEHLGEGSLTTVFSVGNEIAIRIPRIIKHPQMNTFDALKALAEFIPSNETLEKNGQPVVKLYPHESMLIYKEPDGTLYQAEYLIVEKIDFLLNGTHLKGVDLVERIIEGRCQSECLKALHSFQTFLIGTWPFEQIGDFNLEQILWDGQGWKIVDHLNRHVIAKTDRSPTIVEQIQSHIEVIIDELYSAEHDSSNLLFHKVEAFLGLRLLEKQIQLQRSLALSKEKTPCLPLDSTCESLLVCS
jgi:hypothetical protein